MENQESILLRDRFRDARTIGIYLDEWRSDDKGPVRLPNGDPVSDPMACAKYIAQSLEPPYTAKVMQSADVARSRVKEIARRGWHAFALINGRYVLDLWLRYCAEWRVPPVMDIEDEEHLAFMEDVYGPRESWQQAASESPPMNGREVELLAIATTALRDLYVGYDQDDIVTASGAGIRPLLRDLVLYLRGLGIDDQGLWDCDATEGVPVRRAA